MYVNKCYENAGMHVCKCSENAGRCSENMGNCHDSPTRCDGCFRQGHHPDSFTSHPHSCNMKGIDDQHTHECSRKELQCCQNRERSCTSHSHNMPVNTSSFKSYGDYGQFQHIENGNGDLSQIHHIEKSMQHGISDSNDGMLSSQGKENWSKPTRRGFRGGNRQSTNPTEHGGKNAFTDKSKHEYDSSQQRNTSKREYDRSQQRNIQDPSSILHDQQTVYKSKGVVSP